MYRYVTSQLLIDGSFPIINNVEMDKHEHVSPCTCANIYEDKLLDVELLGQMMRDVAWPRSFLWD